ncbi:MAG TPA: PLD nuclease N-terminal domain-containing protein [Anaerolineae bacterium]|nr:PLD nuclease N-terminal domain-containing protein [Anaerolineae bacterium]HOR00179.1 PLD nuclease N-terminal domain-containing protein [Anaerolineae bacterium]
MEPTTDLMGALSTWLPLLAPIVVLQVALQVIAIVDLVRREKVRGGNKWVWGAVIVLGEIIGPLVYFVAGREE